MAHGSFQCRRSSKRRVLLYDQSGIVHRIAEDGDPEIVEDPIPPFHLFVNPPSFPQTNFPERPSKPASPFALFADRSPALAGLCVELLGIRIGESTHDI